MVDSNSADYDGGYPEVDQPLEDCKGCGAPIPVDDLDEGYCYMCTAEDIDDIDDIDDLEDEDLDDSSRDDDSSLRGSKIA